MAGTAAIQTAGRVGWESNGGREEPEIRSDNFFYFDLFSGKKITFELIDE